MRSGIALEGARCKPVERPAVADPGNVASVHVDRDSVFGREGPIARYRSVNRDGMGGGQIVLESDLDWVVPLRHDDPAEMARPCKASN